MMALVVNGRDMSQDFTDGLVSVGNMSSWENDMIVCSAGSQEYVYIYI